MYYTKDTILFLNDRFIKAVDAHSDLYSQTLHYGYGVFEGIRAYQSMNGVKVFKAQEHFERLRESCALIGIPFQYKTSDLIQIAYQLLQKTSVSEAIAAAQTATRCCMDELKQIAGWSESKGVG